MDAFQGSYRTRPCDMRYFSAFYLLLRFLFLLQLHMLASHQAFVASGMLFFLTAAIVTVFQPYKVRAHNTADTVLMILVGITFVINFYTAYGVVLFYRVMFTVLLLVYLISLLVWKSVGGKLQAVMGRMLNAIVHHHRQHGGGKGRYVESFDRDLDSSARNSYPPLLEGPRCQ